MSKSPSAAAIARAVTLADLRVATAGLGPWSRWRARRALKAAAYELGIDLPRDVQHVPDRDPVGATVALLQIAWLRLHGVVLPPMLGGRDAIAERYWSEQSVLAKAPKRPLWVTIAGFVASAGISFGVVRAMKDDPPAWQPPALHSVGAHLPPEREAEWVTAITDWVVALDRLARGRHEGELPSKLAEREELLARHRKAVLADDLKPVFGQPVMDALALMLDGGDTASGGGAGWEAREEVFAEAVRTTNRAMADKGFGYFFDSYAVRYEDDGRAEAALYTFRVDARRRYLAADKPVDALHLRRLDSLNIVQFLLGYTSKRMDVAVLLIDKLEGEVATRLGPALEPEREMPLRMSDEDEGKKAWLDVRKAAGRVVRESYYGAIPGQQQALAELGQLLARRNDLLEDWNLRLAAYNISLREFEALVVEPERRERFEKYTSPEARKVLDAIQSELETPERKRLFERLVARHAQPVELHEVQHRIDYASDDDFAVPAPLLRILQIPPDSVHAESDDVRRIAYELSAYTAEIARDPEWARVNLSLLSEHLYDGSGGAEGWSAVMILEGIGRELGVTFMPIVDPDGRRAGADLETVAAVHVELLGKTGPELARAAATLWQKWFGHALVPLTPLP